MEDKAHSTVKMEQLEESLAKEVRRYKGFYGVSDKYYKNQELTANAWREIGKTLEKNPDRCKEKRKQLQNKFIRLKKNKKQRVGTLGPQDSFLPRI